MNRKEAEEHWKYTEGIILKVFEAMLEVVHYTYVEALLHGAKHERERNE